jgi:acylphosphatase
MHCLNAGGTGLRGDTIAISRHGSILKPAGGRAMQQAKRFHVSGTVQGVGFRFFAERVARRLHLAGYVRNLPDGSVEVYALGEAVSISEMEKELRQGPRMASVADVQSEETGVDAQHGSTFSIEDDG